MLEFSQSYVFPFSRQAGKVGHIDKKYLRFVVVVISQLCLGDRGSGSDWCAYLVTGWKAAGFLCCFEIHFVIFLWYPAFSSWTLHHSKDDKYCTLIGYRLRLIIDVSAMNYDCLMYEGCLYSCVSLVVYHFISMLTTLMSHPAFDRFTTN